MHLIVRGRDLPGVTVAAWSGVHVALQVGRKPVGLVRGDAPDAEWTTTLSLRSGPDGRDFAGAAVQGKRGDRFLYLTWGEVRDGVFTMFRRAKLMLNDLPADVSDEDVVVAELVLTDSKGLPRCARIDGSSVRWRRAQVRS